MILINTSYKQNILETEDKLYLVKYGKTQHEYKLVKHDEKHEEQTERGTDYLESKYVFRGVSHSRSNFFRHGIFVSRLVGSLIGWFVNFMSKCPSAIL